MAQGYDNYNNNYYDDNDMYRTYPTEINKYECRTGPFQGFFVGSVEFCDAKHDKFAKDNRKDHTIERDINKTGTQGPPGPQGLPGVNGTNGIN